MSEANLRRVSELALIGIASIWGLTFVMVKDAIEELPTMALNLANVLSRRLRLANATTYDTTNVIGETLREGKESEQVNGRCRGR